MFAGKPVMQPEDFRLIREFVAEQFGLEIEQAKETYLGMRLMPRLEELRLGSFADYYAYLKFSPHAAQEHRRFISLVTNNETYFFREETQLRALAEEVLPLLKERKRREGKRTLRIISAGCSSGEEVYTLAILLMESGAFLWDWEVRIEGIDIDPQVIARAEEGIYAGRAFQTTPPHIVDRYFRKAGNDWQVKDVLRRQTRFVQGNLLQFEQAAGGDDVDIIFCRNVLIYFGDDTIRHIIAQFFRVLGRERYLFLGHSESLSRITSDFLPLRFPGAIVYRKRGTT